MNKKLFFILIIIILFKFILGPLFTDTIANTKKYLNLKIRQNKLKTLQKENIALQEQEPLQFSLIKIKKPVQKIIKNNYCRFILEKTRKINSRTKKLEVIQIEYQIEGSYDQITRTLTAILALDLPIKMQKLQLQTNNSYKLTALFTLYFLNLQKASS